MLGRTANSLFWMFRYLERSENIARLLDAALRMAITRDVVTAEEEWRSVISTLGTRQLYMETNESFDGHSAWNFVLRDKANPANIREMFGAMRSNARAARTNISSEVWTAVNESYLKLDQMLARPISQSAVYEVVQTIRRAGTRVHGALDGSMLRNEGFHFARAGTYPRARGEHRAHPRREVLPAAALGLSYVGTEPRYRAVGPRAALASRQGERLSLAQRRRMSMRVRDRRIPGARRPFPTQPRLLLRSALRDNLAAAGRSSTGIAKASRHERLCAEADRRLSNMSPSTRFSTRACTSSCSSSWPATPRIAERDRRRITGSSTEPSDQPDTPMRALHPPHHPLSPIPSPMIARAPARCG
jgi:hypothetical protein